MSESLSFVSVSEMLVETKHGGNAPFDAISYMVSLLSTFSRTKLSAPYRRREL